MTARPVEIVVEQLRRPVPGGIGTYCRGLVMGLLAHDRASLPPLRLRASRPPGRPDPLETLDLPVSASFLPGQLLTALWSLGMPAGSSRRGDPFAHAVLHAASFAAPRPRARPLTLMVHDLAFRRLPEAYPRRGRRWHERALARLVSAADAVIVPSELTREDLLSSVNLPHDRVHVVEEGCDHLPPPDAAAAAAVLTRAGLRSGTPYLLSVSTLEPRKNLARLVQAYGLARRELPEPWPLLVVGPPGWGESGIAPGGAEGVLLAGRVEAGALSALYGGARAMCYVPLLEGFGLPAAEAMRAGTPVVASAGLPASGAAAFDVDPLDPHSIAAGIVAAGSDGAVRERLATAGASRAGELSWERTAAGHLDLWRAVSG